MAFSLNTTIIRRTDTYAEEAAELASTVISNRIVAVQQLFAKLAENLAEKLEGGATIEEAHSLLTEYKELWNYSEARLFRYDGGLALNGVQVADKEMRLLERAVKERNIAMGRASYERSIAYAVPVLHGDTLKGVILIVRGSGPGEQLLNIDVFEDSGVTILTDYGGDILVKVWNTDLALPHDDASFISKDKTLVASVFGPD
ncbi:MAG: hypothetical protein IJB29_04490, partial [Mailhella sp.]|nr:hypothetical protein [Mailhella sp.]